MSKTPKHTPWQLERNHATVHVVDANRRAIFDALVAPETNEKAALIAAAPDLLDALEELTEIVQGHLKNGNRLDSFTLQPALAAIRKARGQ